MAAHVSGKDFAEKVLASHKPVLVDFYASWCGPCRLQNAVLDELQQEAADAYSIFKVDTDAESALAVKYGVSALPTLLVFHDGDVVDRFVGLQQKATLKNALMAAT